MHIADVEHGNLGATGIVGGNIPVAVGAGLSQKLQGTDRVVVCFFGDGARIRATRSAGGQPRDPPMAV
jgi:TPP-dependent pyruvate/acetoin dehydrogenase alpha subunit